MYKSSFVHDSPDREIIRRQAAYLRCGILTPTALQSSPHCVILYSYRAVTGLARLFLSNVIAHGSCHLPLQSNIYRYLKDIGVFIDGALAFGLSKGRPYEMCILFFSFVAFFLHLYVSGNLMAFL